MLTLKTILVIAITVLATMLAFAKLVVAALTEQVQLSLVALLAVVIPIVVAELRALRAQRIASAEKAAELAAAAKESEAQREEARQTREEARAAREAADKVALKVEEVAVKAEGVATALAEKSAGDAEAAVDQSAKIEKIAKTTEDTLSHLNGEKSASLKRFLFLAERMKIKTGDATDISIYDEAVAAYDEHQKQQAKVDATAGEPAKPC